MSIGKIANTACNFSELLSRTSQEITTALKGREQQCDAMLGLLQVVPPELQEMKKNINEVLRFVPTMDSLAFEIKQVQDGVQLLQRQATCRFHMYFWI